MLLNKTDITVFCVSSRTEPSNKHKSILWTLREPPQRTARFQISYELPSLMRCKMCDQAAVSPPSAVVWAARREVVQWRNQRASGDTGQTPREGECLYLSEARHLFLFSLEESSPSKELEILALPRWIRLSPACGFPESPHTNSIGVKVIRLLRFTPNTVAG